MKVEQGANQSEDYPTLQPKSGTDDGFDYVVDGLGGAIENLNLAALNNGVKVAFDFRSSRNTGSCTAGPGHPR